MIKINPINVNADAVITIEEEISRSGTFYHIKSKDFATVSKFTAGTRPQAMDVVMEWTKNYVYAGFNVTIVQK
jgi:hypothetical protein